MEHLNRTISGITGDGSLGISLAAGTASDLAGNTALAAGPSTTFTVDNTPPAVAITSLAPTLINTGPISVTVTFSESVTGFVFGDLSIGNGTDSNFSGSGGSHSTLSESPLASARMLISATTSDTRSIRRFRTERQRLLRPR